MEEFLQKVIQLTVVNGAHHGVTDESCRRMSVHEYSIMVYTLLRLLPNLIWQTGLSSMSFELAIPSAVLRIKAFFAPRSPSV